MSTDPAPFGRSFDDGGEGSTPTSAVSSGRRIGPDWRKSTYSGQNDGGCLRIAHARNGTVLVGDSRTPCGPTIRVTGAAWCAFLQTVRSGQLD